MGTYRYYSDLGTDGGHGQEPNDFSLTFLRQKRNRWHYSKTILWLTMQNFQFFAGLKFPSLDMTLNRQHRHSLATA